MVRSSNLKQFQIPTTRIRYIYFFSSHFFENERMLYYLIHIRHRLNFHRLFARHFMTTICFPTKKGCIAFEISLFLLLSLVMCILLFLCMCVCVRQSDALAFVLHFQSILVGNINVYMNVCVWIMEALKCEMFNMNNIECVPEQFSVFAMLAEHRTDTMHCSSSGLEFYDSQQLARCGGNDHSQISMDSATCATLYLIHRIFTLEHEKEIQKFIYTETMEQHRNMPADEEDGVHGENG